jgi:hypothetical protein
MTFYFEELQTQAKEACDTDHAFLQMAAVPYNFFRNRTGYTCFASQALSGNKERLPWEFYLSVHPDDLARAFELVSERLLNSTKGDFYFTVSDPSVKHSRGHIRNQMTLYTFKSSHGEMLQPATVMYNHLRHIEQDLISQGIRVGEHEGHRDKIPGSQYIELGYYPTDGSIPPDDLGELVQSKSNCYALFTASQAPLRVDFTPEEVSAYRALQSERLTAKRVMGTREGSFTLRYIHTQATINRETSTPYDVVPGYGAYYYAKKGRYVDFLGQLMPRDKKMTPWRFNFWVSPEHLETAYQVVASRLLGSDKAHYYFSALDPMIQSTDNDLPDQITLYACMNAEGKLVHSASEMYWNLSFIEKQLRKYGVMPGEMPVDSQMVNGSRYITMEYEPWSREVDTSPSEAMHQINSVSNPFRMFATPSSPLRIDYKTMDEFREAKASIQLPSSQRI